MRILQIAGPANSGKTRLLEALLVHLPAAHIIKWSHHPIAEDAPASDSGRLGATGLPTVLGHPDGLVWRGTLSRTQVYAMVASTVDPDALVVVEGDKWAPHPKIWIGAELPPSALAVGLVIGPKPPDDSTVPWRQAEIPLPDDAIHELTAYLRVAWPTYAVPYGRTIDA